MGVRFPSPAPVDMTTKKSFDLLSEKQRKKAIERIIGYFASERDERIGVIAAENLLDMFLQEAGVGLFNRGVREAKKLIKMRLEDLNLDMELLLREEEKE